MLISYRTGIADEQLAKKEEERGRKRKAGHPNGLRNSLRSITSRSSTSVSTISTNLSRSPRPSAKDNKVKLLSGLPLNSTENRKRRRSSTRSSRSYTSGSSVEKKRREHSRDAGRNLRRRRASTSPNHRGRDRNQSGRGFERSLDGNHKRRRSSSFSSLDHTSESSFEQRRRDSSTKADRKKSRRRSSISPDSRGRDRSFYGKRSNRHTRSRSYSRDRSRVARSRKSMTPGAPPKWDRGQRTTIHSDGLNRGHGLRYSDDNDRYGSSFRGSGQDNPRTTRPMRHSKPEPKVRSLSPFSKRLALTQAMNTSN